MVHRVRVDLPSLGRLGLVAELEGSSAGLLCILLYWQRVFRSLGGSNRPDIHRAPNQNNRTDTCFLLS